jgi:glutathione S-transferase
LRAAWIQLNGQAGALASRRDLRYPSWLISPLAEDLMLTLYYAPGACSLAAHIALEESGEPYEARRMDFSKAEQRTPEYMKIHPLGRVPALLLGTGEPLTENTAILPYIGKKYGMWPVEPVAVARALSVIGFFASTVHPAHAHISRPERYATDKAHFPDIQTQGRKMFHEYLTQVDGMLAGREWMSDPYTVLDPYAFTFYTWGVRRELPMADLKNYTAHKDRMLARPAVQRIVEDEKIKV